VSWLARTQHPAGSWTDFLLAPGPSDAWVTAYTGTALALAANDGRLDDRTRSVAGRCADAAARWLLRATSDGGARDPGAWGWTSSVRADADSTAWAVRLLALRRWPVPAQALVFLAEHRDAGGYRTYRSQLTSGSWAAPTPEVTAAVLLAQHAAGSIDRAGVARQWRSLIAPMQGPDGCWHSMWWTDPAYPTALVGAAWAAAGRPPPAFQLPTSGWLAPGLTGWQVATRLWIAATFGDDHREPLAATLADSQRRDGGWPGGATLRVPPQRSGRPAERSGDARGIFTTATALHALLATGPLPAPAGGAAGQRGRAPSPRRPYDDVVRRMATASGAPTGTAQAAFRALTRESLSRHGVWPARQLSNLAGGTPLEFSVGAAPGLRLTTEVGDPLLPPYQRARSGLRAVGRTAAVLGMASQWAAVRPAIAVLVDRELPVPDGCRFWVWAGLDLMATGRAVLKTYLSLHGEDVPGWQDRELAFLAACGVPPSSPVHAVLDRLREVGWCHEVGVGLVRGAGWGVKVYYELPGYRPDAVRDVLDLCGLDPDPTALTPEIPGVLRASLAAKRRSGIAVRVHPDTGRVDEVTVAAAFPPPLVGRAELADRVRSWLASAEPHDAAVAALLPDWRDAPERARMHSLFTRSRSARGDETKVYLRPWPGWGSPEPPA